MMNAENGLVLKQYEELPLDGDEPSAEVLFFDFSGYIINSDGHSAIAVP